MDPTLEQTDVRTKLQKDECKKQNQSFTFSHLFGMICQIQLSTVITIHPPLEIDSRRPVHHHRGHSALKVSHKAYLLHDRKVN